MALTGFMAKAQVTYGVKAGYANSHIQLGVGYKFGGNGTAPKASKKYQ